jgi:hypothetical protein
MCRGSRMYVMPLPIENPTTLAPYTTGVFFVTPCLICGLFFSCNNPMLTSCKCTYHPFCIIVYLARKTTKCATPGVGNPSCKSGSPIGVLTKSMCYWIVQRLRGRINLYKMQLQALLKHYLLHIVSTKLLKP